MGLRICIFNKVSPDTDAAGRGPHFENHQFKKTPQSTRKALFQNFTRIPLHLLSVWPLASYLILLSSFNFLQPRHQVEMAETRVEAAGKEIREWKSKSSLKQQQRNSGTDWRLRDAGGGEGNKNELYMTAARNELSKNTNQGAPTPTFKRVSEEEMLAPSWGPGPGPTLVCSIFLLGFGSQALVIPLLSSSYQIFHCPLSTNSFLPRYQRADVFSMLTIKNFLSTLPPLQLPTYLFSFPSQTGFLNC